MFKKVKKLAASPYATNFVGRVGLVAVSFCLVSIINFSPTAHKQPVSQKTIAKTQAKIAAPAKPKIAKPAAATPAPTPVAAPAAAAPRPVTRVATPSVTANVKPEPVVTPSPSSSVNTLTPADPAPSSSAGSGGSSGPATTTGYTSTNWSGYLATTGNYTAVSGSWRATSPTGNGVSTSADATWIGIGGVTAGDLIQVGTQNTITAAGQVSTGAFYELLPDYSQPMPSMTVSAGDSMSATITEVSTGQWMITINDVTTGQTYTKNVAYASGNSSAEWIEEDPSYSARRQIPFDNFGSAAFSGAATTSNGSALNLVGANAQPITMVNRSGQPIATPSAIGGNGFSVTQN